MTDNKFRRQDSASLSDAFVGMDYEIKPKMVEVWNGKRIAWAVAIFSTLLLIPIVYLLYNSYWNDSQEQSQITAKNAPQSQGLQPQSSSMARPPVVITAPETSAQTDASSALPVIDNQTRARLAKQSLEEVSASIIKPLTETDKATETSTKQIATLAAKTTSKATAPKVESKPIVTASKQEPRPQGKQVSSSTTISLPPAQAKSQRTADAPELSEKVNQTDSRKLNTRVAKKQSKTQEENLLSDAKIPDAQAIADPINTDTDLQQLDGADNGKSEHVSRAHLVSAIRNLEPVGADLNTLTIKQGQSHRIVYFTEVQGLAGQNITYRWLREGQLVFSKKIPVTGNHTWRSYIKKLIKSSMAGNWVVELRDDQNLMLSQQSFEVLEASE